MRMSCIAFTERGLALARRVAADPAWDASVARGYGEGKADLREWTAQAFSSADALLFVGAAGIAVRAIAPHVLSKASDPAVVVLDEGGRFSIPLLSGHIGGANELARRIARIVGATCAITTATDGRGLWAVDEWAARAGLSVANPHAIKTVSSRLLAGGEVSLYADVPLSGEAPERVSLAARAEGADIIVSPYAHLEASCAGERPSGESGPSSLQLRLVAPCIVAGIGCRRGAPAEAIEEAFLVACEQAGISPLAVRGVATIDVKAHEEGLLAFCRRRNIPLATYSAEELSQVEGSVSPSDFVRATVGVDNVCERAALAGGGELIFPKIARDGVTVAFSKVTIELSFKER